MGDDHNQRPNWPAERQEFTTYSEFPATVPLAAPSSPTFSGTSTFAAPSLCASPNNGAPCNGVNAPKYGTLVPNRIFVGGLELSTTDDELSNLFCGYGLIKSAKVIVDRAGVSKGYGFVTFVAEDDAKKLMMNSDHVQLNGRRLNIAPAIKKQGFVGGSHSFENAPTPTVSFQAPNPMYFGTGVPPYPYGNPYSMYVQQPASQMHAADTSAAASMYQSPYMNTGPGVVPNGGGTNYQLIYQPPQPAGSQPMFMSQPGQFQYHQQLNPASTWVDPGMSTHYQISPSLPYLVPMY